MHISVPFNASVGKTVLNALCLSIVEIQCDDDDGEFMLLFRPI